MNTSNQHHLNGFNVLAPFYDLLSHFVFRGAIQEAQLRGLSFLKGDEHLWMIGGGTGWALSHYLTHYPQLKVTYIEASSTMIELAKKKLSSPQEQRVRWIHHTHDWIYQNPHEIDHCDGLITFFFLDVLNPQELETFFSWIDQHQGHENQKKRSWIWLFADFCPHPSRWKMYFIAFMYWCFKWTTGLKNKTLGDYLEQFRKRGWTEVDEHFQSISTSNTIQKNSSLSQKPLRSSWAGELIQSRVYYRA